MELESTTSKVSWCIHCRYQLESVGARCRYCGGSAKRSEDTGRPDLDWPGLFNNEWLDLTPVQREAHLRLCSYRHASRAGRFAYNLVPTVGGNMTPSWATSNENSQVGGHSGILDMIGLVPPEIWHHIMKHCSTETIFCAIAADRRISAIVSRLRWLMIQELAVLPGHKLELGRSRVLSTGGLFNVMMARAKKNYIAKNMTADCCEIIFEYEDQLVGNKILVDSPGNSANRTTLMMASDGPMFVSLNEMGQISLNQSRKSPNSGMKVLHIVNENGVIAVLMEVIGHRKPDDPLSGRKSSAVVLHKDRPLRRQFRIEFYKEGAEVMKIVGAGYDIEAPVCRIRGMSACFHPIHLTVQSHAQVAILWNDEDSSWQGSAELITYLNPPTILGLTSVGVYHLHEPRELELLLGSQRHGRRGHRPTRIKFLAQGCELAVYLDNDCFPQRTLDLNGSLNRIVDARHERRDRLFFIDFVDGLPFHATCRKEVHPLGLSLKRWKMSYLSLAQVTDTVNHRLEDIGCLGIMRIERITGYVSDNSSEEEAHLDRMPWLRESVTNISSGFMKGIVFTAKLEGWFSTDAAKIGPDGLAVDVNGESIAAALANKILVWAINTDILHTIQTKHPHGPESMEDDEDQSDYWIKEVDGWSGYELPIIKPIELDIDGAEIRQIKWGHGRKLIVLTSRGVQIWNLGDGTQGKRTVKVLDGDELRSKLSC